MVILEKFRKKYQIWTNNDEEILVTTFDCRLKGEMRVVLHLKAKGKILVTYSFRVAMSGEGSPEPPGIRMNKPTESLLQLFCHT
jgi:hypothetical protein